MSFIVDPLTLLTFVPAALALNLMPGPDMMFCLGQGLRNGARAALAANIGISLGGMVHVLAAGLGIGALITALPWLFDVIRWVGVGYLLWLAWGALKARPTPATAGKASAHAFRDGLITNLTNPKVILFALAFIPQFVDPARGAVLAQFVIFGMVLSLGGLLVNGAVGLSAGGIGRRFAGSGRAMRALQVISATIFGALALRLAFMSRN